MAVAKQTDLPPFLSYLASILVWMGAMTEVYTVLQCQQMTHTSVWRDVGTNGHTVSHVEKAYSTSKGLKPGRIIVLQCLINCDPARGEA